MRHKKEPYFLFLKTSVMKYRHKMTECHHIDKVSWCNDKVSSINNKGSSYYNKESSYNDKVSSYNGGHCKAEILPVRRETLSNQSTNQSIII